MRKSGLHEDIIQDLGALIRERGLAPGSRLPTEDELCQVLDVGRGRLREAIRILVALGYVEVRHGGGMFLTTVPAPIIFQPIRALIEFGVETQLELLQIRHIIESEVIAQVARARDPETVRQLEGIVARLGGPVLSVEELVQLDLTFHFTLVQATRNNTLVRLMASLGTLLAANLTETLRLPGAQDRSYREHRALLDAVLASDEQRAREEMAQHLSIVEARLRSALIARQPLAARGS